MAAHALIVRSSNREMLCSVYSLETGTRLQDLASIAARGYLFYRIVVSLCRSFVELRSNTKVVFPESFFMVRHDARNAGIVFLSCATVGSDGVVARIFAEGIEIKGIVVESTFDQRKLFSSY